MADVTTANVVVLASWTEGGVSSKRHTALHVEADITGAGSGATGKKIPASAFGLSKVEEVSTMVNDDSDAIYKAAPNFEGTEILVSAEDTNAPADITDLVRFVVRGY